MSVWFAIPSIRPLAEAEPRLEMWRKQGYHLAILRQGEPVRADILVPTAQYQGWPASINLLARKILAEDSTAIWIVGGGDDTQPDLAHSPCSISNDCVTYFGGTFGVMQPTGDRWGDTPQMRQLFGENRGALIDRVAGSPWMGRDWCRRAYGGRGPMYPEYHHLFVDEELQEVATRLNVFWQRRDLIQLHDHPLRKEHATQADWPDFLKPINTPESWERHKKLFNERKLAGFPGHEPTKA